jgi:hypothetical protein
MALSDIFGLRLAEGRVKIKRIYDVSYWRRIKLFKDFKKNFYRCGVCRYQWEQNLNTLYFNRPIIDFKSYKFITVHF